MPKTAAATASAPTDARVRAAVDAGRVDRRVALAAGDEPAVERVREHPGHHERDRERAPEEEVVEAGLHGAGDREHDPVVDDLHHRDARRVRGERDRDDDAERQAGAEQRQAEHGPDTSTPYGYVLFVGDMNDERTHTVTGMTRGHCVLSVREEVEEVAEAATKSRPERRERTAAAPLPVGTTRTG